MKNIPKKIYLQIAETKDEFDKLDFNELKNVLWQKERVFKTDIEYQLVKKKRTNDQNSSIWLFCTWISILFNDSGEMYMAPMQIEIPWTKDLVMEIYWRPLQKQLFKKKSTTELNTNEVSPIADAIIMHMANKGYNIEFPNWQSFLNKTEKL